MVPQGHCRRRFVERVHKRAFAAIICQVIAVGAKKPPNKQGAQVQRHAARTHACSATVITNTKFCVLVTHRLFHPALVPIRFFEQESNLEGFSVMSMLAASVRGSNPSSTIGSPNPMIENMLVLLSKSTAEFKRGRRSQGRRTLEWADELRMTYAE
eukprot:SAG11_NODE_9203_length_933_cov_1.700240_1_plen_156_part_00